MAPWRLGTTRLFRGPREPTLGAGEFGWPETLRGLLRRRPSAPEHLRGDEDEDRPTKAASEEEVKNRIADGGEQDGGGGESEEHGRLARHRRGPGQGPCLLPPETMKALSS